MDRFRKNPCAFVNRALAEKFFPNENPIGKTFETDPEDEWPDPDRRNRGRHSIRGFAQRDSSYVLCRPFGVTDFEPLLDSDQAASLLGIHRKTLQKMARRGEIHAAHVGKLWRFRASDLNDWLYRQERKLTVCPSRNLSASDLDRLPHTLAILWTAIRAVETREEACFNGRDIRKDMSFAYGAVGFPTIGRFVGGRSMPMVNGSTARPLLGGIRISRRSKCSEGRGSSAHHH